MKVCDKKNVLALEVGEVILVVEILVHLQE